MDMTTTPLSPPATETSVKSILEWLALAHGRSGSEDADQLHAQFLLLRETPVPPGQRLKLLDLLYGQAERIVNAEIPQLNDVTLPISRRLRQHVRVILDMLKTLAQDYFNTLADLFDPEGPRALQTPHTSLRRAMQAIAWQININYLLSAPSTPGHWQQLHAAYRTAQRLGIESFPGPQGTPSIAQLYSRIVLAAIAQPASFSSNELEFIWAYTTQHTPPLELLEQAPMHSTGIFWIDPDRDFPAYALIRRLPVDPVQTRYFACDAIAEQAKRHHEALSQGAPASSLGLPAFADTHAGQAILLRLHQLWGHPTKRKFPRRRQSYRAHICIGLTTIWQLAKQPSRTPPTGEWMVTNESPDGYAVMHMSGQAENIRVGEIVALQPQGERAEATPVWHICMIRWATSENPEHLELGLEILTSRAQAVEIVRADEQMLGKVSGLILPETPPLRPQRCLVAPAGLIREGSRRVVILAESDKLEVLELQVTHLVEQTGNVEAFSVQPEDSP